MVNLNGCIEDISSRNIHKNTLCFKMSGEFNLRRNYAPELTRADAEENYNPFELQGDGGAVQRHGSQSYGLRNVEAIDYAPEKRYSSSRKGIGGRRSTPQRNRDAERSSTSRISSRRVSSSNSAKMYEFWDTMDDDTRSERAMRIAETRCENQRRAAAIDASRGVLRDSTTYKSTGNDRLQNTEVPYSAIRQMSKVQFDHFLLDFKNLEIEKEKKRNSARQQTIYRQTSRARHHENE